MIPTGRRVAVTAEHARAAARAAALALWYVLSLALPAHAEKADREKPIRIEADRVTVDDAKQVAVFEGNVVLTQGTLMIRADRMQIRQDSEGFKYGTAWGNLAYFRQKRDGYDEYIEGWSERIEYDGRADRMQMFNRALLKRGQDEVRGNYISYDAATEFFQVIGGGPKAATPENPEGRVRAILQPKSREKPAAGAPVTLTPADKIRALQEESGAAGK